MDTGDYYLPLLFMWIFLCRRRFETTEKLRPQPSNSHLNATISMLLQKVKGLITFLSGVTVHMSLQGTRSRKLFLTKRTSVLLHPITQHTPWLRRIRIHARPSPRRIIHRRRPRQQPRIRITPPSSIVLELAAKVE
jgi:hypothetical protein